MILTFNKQQYIIDNNKYKTVDHKVPPFFTGKINSTIEQEKGYKGFTIKFQPFFLIGGDH